MGIESIIAIQLLVFLVSTWVICRMLASWSQAGKMWRPMVASVLLIVWLAMAPYGLLFLLGPFANQVFMAYPVLQKGAWDVGLAFALWLGMEISYLLGPVVGAWGIWCFFKTKPVSEAVEHVH